MKDQSMSPFQEKLKKMMKIYAHAAYSITRYFPKEEQYNSSSQLRRSALSIPLNYVEGYARRRKRGQLYFFEIAYGSLKESLFLIEFATDQHWITNEHRKYMENIGDEIGAMLYSEIQSVRGTY